MFSTLIILRMSGRGCGGACFLTKVEKNKQSRTDASQLATERVSSDSPVASLLASPLGCGFKRDAWFVHGYIIREVAQTSPCGMRMTSGIKEVFSFNHCSIFRRG